MDRVGPAFGFLGKLPLGDRPSWPATRRMLVPQEADDAVRFAAALKALPDRDPPSKSNPNLRLQGLADTSRAVETWFGRRAAHRQSTLDEKAAIAASR